MEKTRHFSWEGLMRTHNCGELRKDDLGSKVVLCGWVNKSRNLGGLHFIDIRDKYGLTQLSFDHFKGDHGIIKQCSLESVIKATGVVRQRPESALNPKMATGEIEIEVHDLEILSVCNIDSIPFLPYGQIEATEDLRLKYRYLDLRTERLQNMLKTRSQVTLKIRNLLSSFGFIEVETPILYKSTPEGARDYIVPSRVHPHHVYALPQSPQTLKQLLMIGGTDRYFQICRCFRDEDLRADRQPEFTQVDIEVSFATQQLIKELSVELIREIYGLEKDFQIPMMCYDEAMRRYGSDKPDTRFGLEHHVVNSIFEKSTFGVFQKAIESKGLIKAMFISSELASLSRKDLDGLVEVVKPHGGKGVAFVKKTGAELSGGIAKFFDKSEIAALEALEKGDGTWLFFADEEDIAHSSADAVRRHLGRQLGLIKKGLSFLWVYDFPLFEWSGDRFAAKHHPFTSPKESEMDRFFSADPKDPHGPFKTMKADAYDLVCNGHELGGGSIRIHSQDVQKRMFEILGLSQEEVKKQFGFFVEALTYGTPPHGGLAFGLERVVMILSGTDNIRDVMAFPKTTKASDLMSQAPSIPAAEQLSELNFTWVK